MKRAAKKTIVVIYRVMYTEHDEFTLRTEAIECIDNESLNEFGVYELASCTSSISLHKYITKIC